MKGSNHKKNKNIVVIGGGTGIFSVLTALKNKKYNLSVIVSMADDGGSSGILREEFGILPPGDVRRALVALSQSPKILTDLFNFRFEEGMNLKGHNLGNLLITALERMTGSFEKALFEIRKILNVKGNVIPVTLDNSRLYAELENGLIIKGETNIDIPKHNGNLKIKRVFLKPKSKINPVAEAVLLKADFIILGPGDLYTSIIPNLLVKNVFQNIKKSKAKKIYIVNLMTKFGETNHFKASDFIKTIEKYLGKKVLDYVLINTKRPDEERLREYAAENAEFVEYNKNDLKKFNYKFIYGNFLRSSGFLRHDPNKLAKSLIKIINGNL